MTIIKSAEVDMIGFGVGSNPATQGQIAIRWAKITYDDTAPNVILIRENHRTVLNPGDDVDATMAAVNADLTAQGFGAMPASDIELVKAQAAMVWTPAVASAYQAWVTAQALAAQAQADTDAAAQAVIDASIAAEQQAAIDAAVAAALAKQQPAAPPA